MFEWVQCYVVQLYLDISEGRAKKSSNFEHFPTLSKGDSASDGKPSKLKHDKSLEKFPKGGGGWW